MITGNLVPEHTAIARFRQTHSERFAHVFTEVLALCAGAGMTGVGMVAVDGTKLSGPAALSANRTSAPLGWTKPMLRDPEAADRWSWLILAAHTQLRLARPLAIDYRLPWQRPLAIAALTPARVRKSFHRVRTCCTQPARAPMGIRAGPGRPPGTHNKRKAPIQPIGKQPPPG